MFHTAGQVGYSSFCHSHVLDERELALGSWKRKMKLGERQSQPQQHMEHSNFSRSTQHEAMNRKNKEEKAQTQRLGRENSPFHRSSCNINAT